MIGDPVALSIRQKIQRPTAALLERFAGAQTSFICDAMNSSGGLPPAIKPIVPGARIMGPAITAKCGHRDNLAAMAALDYLQPGDVLVIATAGDKTGAVVGDHWAAVAKQNGAIAVITDGLVRDADGIDAVGIPTFAAGLAPNAGFPTGPGTVNLPITIGELTIDAGDIVIADRDGVTIVPLARADAIADRLDHVRAAEADAEAAVAAGTRTSMWNPAKFADGRIDYVD
jgi:4-hydroxy-4-methyl-2-oxoglutarate aldolase